MANDPVNPGSSRIDQMTEVLHADMARFPRARLSVTKGPDKGAEVVLEGQSVVVGSDESCQLRLTDTSVSRRHFELTGGPGGYRLRDLRSTNGVHLEGVQVIDAKLSEKDWVNEVVFIGLLIVPVYQIAMAGDYLVFNTIDYWSGKSTLTDPGPFPGFSSKD